MSRDVLEREALESGERLDRLLAQGESDLSRSRWQDLIKNGHVEVDGEVIRRPSFRVTAGQRIRAEVPDPAPPALEPEPIRLDILYEDEDLIALNKPAGMVVHPSAGHPTGTLVHAVLAHAPDIEGVGGERRPGVVHRLDKGTSGVMVMAKNDRTHRWLQRQFKARAVEKVYLALVDGRTPSAEGIIRAPISRHSRYRQRMAVVPEGKGRESETHFRTLESFSSHTLLEVRPRTGRTHQIRVHLEYLGAPVAGDVTYGRDKPSIPLKRPFLHALRLEIPRPRDAGTWGFQAPLPAELERILTLLRSAVEGS